MMKFMEPIIFDKGTLMNTSERELFHVACKRTIEPNQKLYKIICQCQKVEKFAEYKSCLEEYKEKIGEKLETGCQQIIDLIKRNFTIDD